jgi:hypothetical protein
LRSEPALERDDGEDVLIKKKWGAADFEIEIVEVSVDGVRINPDRERSPPGALLPADLRRSLPEG